jgi:hypothetical protein
MAGTSFDRLPEIPYRQSIFIASSGQAKEVAKAVEAYFAQEYAVHVWTDVFGVNESTIQTLINRTSYDDFFIGVFAADDRTVIKHRQKMVTRGNVVFEFGLFLGCIGIHRSFFLLEEGADLFTDWGGLTVTYYKKGEDLTAAVAESCRKIEVRMLEAARKYKFSLLPSTSLAVGYYHNFLKPVLDALSNEKSFDIIRKNKEGEVLERFTQKIEDHSPTIEIQVPRNLASLERMMLRVHTADFTQLVLGTRVRDFPFYVRSRVSPEEDLRLFDIPTTLLSSYITIQSIFSESFLAEEGNLQRLMDREIRNFEETLHKLIPDEQEHKFYRFTIY